MNALLDYTNNSSIEDAAESIKTTIHISYREVFENHDENISNKWSNYLEIYQDAYQRFIGKSPNVLEIGVQNGGSLQIANKYFINGNIYGVDIDQKVCEMKLGSNIKTYCFDINNQETFQKHFSDIKFDIILDDGSHINSDIVGTFKTLFSQLKPGGVYLVEDLHTSYWPDYGGGYLKKGTAIEFFKGFIDLLNAYHHHLIDENFIENLSDDNLYVFKWLGSVTFYDSVVAIKKLQDLRTGPYEPITTGILHPVMEVKHYDKLLYNNLLYKNITGIQNALENGANIDHMHGASGTALYWAAQKGSLEVAETLLDAGANTEIKAVNNMTPLIISVQNHNFNMTNLLINAGANLETPNGLSSTPLFIASYFGYDDILRLLLDNGANKNVQVQGISAFIASLQQEHLSTAQLLAGSMDNFCQQIQATEFEVKYMDLCGEITAGI